MRACEDSFPRGSLGGAGHDTATGPRPGAPSLESRASGRPRHGETHARHHPRATGGERSRLVSCRSPGHFFVGAARGRHGLRLLSAMRLLRRSGAAIAALLAVAPATPSQRPPRAVLPDDALIVVETGDGGA